MDRSRPLYRLFNLTEEPDGRAAVWFHVGVDNTPQAEVSPALSARLFYYVECQPWVDLFWNAFSTNKKATLYEPLHFSLS